MSNENKNERENKNKSWQNFNPPGLLDIFGTLPPKGKLFFSSNP
jgi:hypothetical protein